MGNKLSGIRQNLIKPYNKLEIEAEKEEYMLGTALRRIRTKLIDPYNELKNDEEKKLYNQNNPELDEVMAIVDEIDRNNPKSKKKIKIL